MIELPVTRRGRRSEAQQAEYERQLSTFCEQILEINSKLDFQVSARGWCYILEEYGLRKGEFDKAQRLMGDARKAGLLPLNITAEDDNRETARAGNGLVFDRESAEDYLQNQAEALRDQMESLGMFYTPWPFWDSQTYYVEMLVEKIDLKSLFNPVCSQFYVPLTNSRGWADIHSRANMMRRFQEHEANGRKCVLLYCGDHDPGGLHISEQLRQNLADMERAVGWSPDDLIIKRFGLNYDFIIENNLSWAENLETSSGKRLDDPRHKDHRKPYVQDYLNKYGARKVEANALVTRPEAGRALCCEAITEWIEADSIRQYHAAVQTVRDDLRQHVPDVVRQLAEAMLDDE